MKHKNKTIKTLLKMAPKYSYRMCHNGSGEVYNPDGSTYDIFDNRKGLINILAQLTNTTTP